MKVLTENYLYQLMDKELTETEIGLTITKRKKTIYT